MFEVDEGKVTIKDTEYKLTPLTGKHLPKLYKFLSKIAPLQESLKSEDTKVKYEKIFEALDEEALQAFHFVCVESLKDSYPEQDLKVIDKFVSQNLLSFFEPILTLNMPKE
jgi:hypothetical protein